MSDPNINVPDEGGLRPPPGLSFWGQAWWWFHFLILVKLARLRFIAILIVISLVIVKWDLIVAYYDKFTRSFGQTKTASADFEYFCPMHPTVIRDNPKDKCPICFMPLSKRKKGEEQTEALPPGIVNRLQLSPYRVVLAGIKTWKVTTLPLVKEITTVGFVEFNEREQKHVAARVKARIDRLYVNETGQWVNAEQELASLYSPDLVVTVQSLIDANRAKNATLEESSRDRLRLWGINDAQIERVIAVQNLIDAIRKNDRVLLDLAEKQLAKIPSGDELADALHNLLAGQKTQSKVLLQEARQRLMELDMPEDQIDDIAQSGKATRHLLIRSPIKGHVLKKYVKEGQTVEEGSPLYDIIDLATVWIQAQVYEEDMAFLPMYHHRLKDPGKVPNALTVRATTRAAPGETFTGHLSFVYPHVDQETRTVIARFELDNPGHRLRPGTSATVQFKLPPTRLDLFTKTRLDDWWQETSVDGLRNVFSPSGSGLGPLLQAAGKAVMHQHGHLLAVPEGAVIDTGHQQIVYREVLPGEYEGVKVTLGPRMTGPDDVTYYPVLHGLEVGDMVVTAGSFLIDAETRLNPAAGSIYFGGSGSSRSQGGVTTRPSTPADEDAKVKAALDKLSATDRKLAETQRLCPILEGSRLGSMGVPVKITLDNQPVFLCCAGCQGKAKAKPQETLKKVEQLKLKNSK